MNPGTFIKNYIVKPAVFTATAFVLSCSPYPKYANVDLNNDGIKDEVGWAQSMSMAAGGVEDLGLYVKLKNEDGSDQKRPYSILSTSHSGNIPLKSVKFEDIDGKNGLDLVYQRNIEATPGGGTVIMDVYQPNLGDGTFGIEEIIDK